mmetsp:Transcript_22388/g.55336  ORF Transcript_22388/g.55336 Transcript_22388/m.55336 type:complete len:228 (-) Transcript_22388:54-737(-)
MRSLAGCDCSCLHRSGNSLHPHLRRFRRGANHGSVNSHGHQLEHGVSSGRGPRRKVPAHDGVGARPGAEGGGLDDSHAAEEHGERAGGSGGIDCACAGRGRAPLIPVTVVVLLDSTRPAPVHNPGPGKAPCAKLADLPRRNVCQSRNRQNRSAARHSIFEVIPASHRLVVLDFAVSSFLLDVSFARPPSIFRSDSGCAILSIDLPQAVASRGHGRELLVLRERPVCY